MSITTVRNKINNWLTPKWANLVSKQDAYFAANGRYFQGLWTHSAEIEQTDTLAGDIKSDRLNDRPTDQTHRWSDLMGTAFTNLPFPARFRIDVYDGPKGQGWVATLQVRYKGKVYERAQQVGPEKQLTHDWQMTVL